MVEDISFQRASAAATARVVEGRCGQVDEMDGLDVVALVGGDGTCNGTQD